MTTQYNDGRGSSGAFLAFLLALILGAAAMAVFVRQATTGFMSRIADKITGRTTAFDTSVPAIVQRIQKLNRLETVVYSLDTIVEGSRSSADAALTCLRATVSCWWFMGSQSPASIFLN